MTNGNDERVLAWGLELRRVHQRLRDALEVAEESVQNGVSPERASSDLQLFCRGFCTALSGHHTSEDDRLFPLVADRRPDLAPVIAQLEQDHSMINHLIGAFEHALRSGADQAALLGHLEGIGAVMESHFRYEERRLTDVLDGVVDPRLDTTLLFGPLA